MALFVFDGSFLSKDFCRLISLSFSPDDFVYKKSRPVYTSTPVSRSTEKTTSNSNSTGASSDDVIVVDDDSPGLANGEPPRKQTLREMLAGIPGFSLKVV